MTELTLAIFKPDTFSEAGIKNNVQQDFFKELKANNLEIIILGEYFKFTPKLVEEHYGHTKKYGNNTLGKNIFDEITKFLIPENKNEVSKCQALVVCGEDAISKVRKIIGPTKFAKEGIRATSESARIDSPKNYIHASGLAKDGDPYKEAKEEIARFFEKEYDKLKKDKRFSEFFNSNK